MAYTYTVPQLRVFQQFAASQVTNTTSMQACIVAPHYLVADGEGAESLIGTFVSGTPFSSAYPGTDATHVVQSTDLASFQVFVRDALVERHVATYSTAEGTPATLTAKVIGNLVQFGDEITGDDATFAFKVGDKIRITGTVTGGTTTDYTIAGFVDDFTAYVSAAIDTDDMETDETEIQVLSVEDIEVTEEAGVVCTVAAVTIQASLSFDSEDVLGGTVYAAFRALDTTYAGVITTVSRLGDVETLLGVASPRNPLAAMVATAFANSNSTPVSFIAVTANTAAAYTTAFDLLDEDTTSYSVVPFDTTAAVHTALVTKLAALAGADRMNWKIGWVAYDVADEITVLDEDLAGAGIDITLAEAATTLTFTGVGLGVVSAGDRMDLSTTLSRTIRSVNALAGTVTVTESVPAATYTDVVFVHPYTAGEKTALVAAYAATFDNPRIRLVFGDGPALVGYPTEAVSCAYLAAAAAGLRSASAPHQPLTRVELEGVSLTSGSGYSGSNLDNMAASGVWIVARESGSSTIYTRHQLTTCTSEYRQREDSKITNADELSRHYREGLNDLYGRANISDELIEMLYLKLDTIHQTIQSRLWDWRLGRQITEITEVSVSRDPDMADRLLVHVAMGTPDPLNSFDVYLTIA